MKKRGKLLVGLMTGVLVTLCSGIAVFASDITQTAQTQDSITVSLDPSITASTTSKFTGWKIYLQKYDDSFNKVNITPEIQLAPTQTSYTFTNLTPGTEYDVRGEYYETSSTGRQYSYNLWTDAATMPGKVTNLHQNKWWYYAHSVDFEWDKQDAYKYEWVAVQQGKKKKQVAQSSFPSSGTTGSFKVQNNKMYTVRVRAFNTINNQTFYGEWSDDVYLFTQPMVVSRGGVRIDGSGRMTVKWDKIDGVDGYEVYASTKELTGYKRVAKVKKNKNSVTVKKLGKKKFSSKKTYFVYIVAKKKIRGVVNTSGRHYSMMYKKGSNTLRWSFDK